MGTLGSIAALHSQAAPTDEEFSESWSQGPVRWLFLSSDERACRRLSSAGDWASFIDEFWRRRDPAPAEVGNPTRETFLQRIEQADTLFSGHERGSLTPRGRVYLLLGPPAYISQQYQAIPGWNAQATLLEASAATQHLLVETWRWRPEDLNPAMRAQLARKKWKLELETRFEVSPDGHRLLAGDDLLRLAARSLVLRSNNTVRAQDGS